MDRDRRVLVAGWIGSTNLGDELVFAGLRRKLADRGVEPVAISIDPAATARQHQVEAVRPGRALVGRRDRPRAAILGGGGLLQDETSSFNLPYHLMRVRLAGPPFAGIGLGAGPLDTRVGRILTRSTMRRAVAVAVRDEGSADVLAGLGLPRPAVAADLALANPPPEVETRDRLVVMLRPWSGTRSRRPVGARRPDPPPEWFVAGMAAALDDCATRTGLSIHFVALQRDRDGAVHELVAARMKTAVTTAAPTLETVLSEVAASRAVVSMRYHGAIAAALGGRPAVMIGYSPKVPSLAADLAAGAVSLAWSPEDALRLPAALEAVIDCGEEMTESRERLCARERVNDRVLDRLLEL